MNCHAIKCDCDVVEPRLFCANHWLALSDEDREALMDHWYPNGTREQKEHEYDLFMALVRAVNNLGLREEHLTYAECRRREETAERAYKAKYGKRR